jgi:hypothetical protein
MLRMPEITYIFFTNVNDVEVVRWDSGDTVTHNRLIRDDIMVPENVIGLEVIVSWR